MDSSEQSKTKFYFKDNHKIIMVQVRVESSQFRSSFSSLIFCDNSLLIGDAFAVRPTGQIDLFRQPVHLGPTGKQVF